MKDETEKVVLLFARYIFVFLIGLGNLVLFYKILTPSTVFVVSKLLSIFTDVYVLGNLLILNDLTVELIPACVAGSAFFLLFLLAFTTADIKPLQRFYVVATAVLLLFALNVARILFLIAIAGESYFEAVHWTLWNLVSIFFVVGIWFFTAWLYKVKSIPVFSDIVFLRSLAKRKVKKKVLKKREHTKRGRKHQ